ncbi:MAG TPA: hypothetical protein VGL86_32795, partial [Polyangia bacterium]
MRHLSVVLLCFAVGCGATNPNHGGGGSGGTGGGGTGGTGGGGTGGSGGGGSGGSGGGTGTGDCSDAAKLIYVIDQDGTFSSFKPDQMTIANSVFTDIGKLNCSGAGGFYEPFSMSVDRNAVAWVEYVDQSGGLGGGSPNMLFNVSTANAACTPTSFTGGQQGFDEFGMGFVSNAAMSTDETLFIGGGDMVGGSSNLGTLDTTSLMITKGNSLTGDPELTGTGLADLWGFFPVTGNNTMARVSKIDKSSAMESSQIPLTSLTGMASAWAFAFYGGDFYVFLASGNKATIVYHVTQNGGTQPVDMLDTGTRHIVGAGVSTCAPTT